MESQDRRSQGSASLLQLGGHSFHCKLQRSILKGKLIIEYMVVNYMSIFSYETGKNLLPYLSSRIIRRINDFSYFPDLNVFLERRLCLFETEPCRTGKDVFRALPSYFPQKNAVKQHKIFVAIYYLFILKDFIYLFIETETERERERGRGRDTGRGKSRLHAGSPAWDS